MKHLAKSKSFVSGRLLPIALVVMLVASMVTIAFSVTPVSAAETTETADFQNVPVGKGNNEDDAHWVDATYYDYLSDAEMDTEWLKPIQAGTSYNGSEDNWYPFYKFNEKISSFASSKGWDYPLYLGNFCNNYDAYPDKETTHGGPFTKASALTGYNYVANDSNGLKNYNVSVSGLVNKQLGAGNTLLTNGGDKMPLFDNDYLKNNNMAKIITSQFPFRQEKVGDVTTYKFDSTRAKDNVFFNWNGKTPTSVGYGQGDTPDKQTKYGIVDGVTDFMGPGSVSGYGIFPFNTNGSGGSTNLDYGFGIKLNMDFKVPAGGTLPDGNPVTFNYSGDDDLWVYISEADGSNSKLVLDLGGDHKMAKGTIDFQQMIATAEESTDISEAAIEDALFIYDSEGWGSDMRVWAWNSTSGGEWFTPEKDSREDVRFNNVYFVKASAKGSKGNSFSDMTSFIVTNKEATDASWTGVKKAEAGKFLFIEDSNNWGDNMKLWGWKEGEDGEWFDLTKTEDGYYTVSSDDKGSKGHQLIYCTDAIVAKVDGDLNWKDQSSSFNLWEHYNHITTTAAATTIGAEKNYEPKITERLNHMNYNDNLSYLGGDEHLAPATKKTETPFAIGSADDKNKPGTGAGSSPNCLDPNKVYHMTIFYMERGLIESNCQMAFTMTPAQNLLEVTNDVRLTDLNPALVEPVKAGENFNFTSKDVDDIKSFNDDINDPDETDTTVVGSKDYNNKFVTGSDLNVTQAETTLLKYLTTWNVIDKGNENKKIDEYDKSRGDSEKKTRDFTLINSKNANDTANMQVNFINTPIVSNLRVTKKVFDQLGAADPNAKTFNFNILVDIGDGNGYKAYPLSLEKTGTVGRADANGDFSFMSNEQVLFKGLPIGTKFKITENTPTNYTEKNSGVITGVIAEGENLVEFENSEKPTEPPTTAPPTTEPPTTAPPTTEPPTTEPPTTEPPTTEPPTTEAPTKEPPTTEPPTTEPPTTEPPTTEPPTTEPPTTEAPTTAPPTTEAPTTAPPTTEVTEPAAPVIQDIPAKIKKTIVDSNYTELYSTAAIGDTVQFELKATTAGTTLTKLQAYTIVDTMSEGFDFNKVLSVRLRNDDKNLNIFLGKNEWKYKATDDGFEISLASSVLNGEKFYGATHVIVNYTADLNEDAVIGPEGNPNEDSLKWTNALGEDKEAEGNEVIVYTFEIDVNKVDNENNKPLKGAQFSLYKSEKNALADKNALMKATSDEDGIAPFVGLDEGDYYIKETRTIDGYRLNTKIYKVSIKPKFNKDGELTAPEDGIVNTTIKNIRNTPLPKTGYDQGIFNSVFFTAAGAFMISAAGLLFFFAFRKKKN